MIVIKFQNGKMKIKSNQMMIWNSQKIKMRKLKNLKKRRNHLKHKKNKLKKMKWIKINKIRKEVKKINSTTLNYLTRYLFTY